MSVTRWDTPEQRARRAEESARRAQREAAEQRRRAQENERRAQEREAALSREYEKKMTDLSRRMAEKESDHKTEVARMGQQVRELIRQQSEAHAKEMQAQRETLGMEIGRMKTEQSALRTEIKDSERRTAEQMKTLSRSVDTRIAGLEKTVDVRMNALSKEIDEKFDALERNSANVRKQAQELFEELDAARAHVLSIDPDGFYLRESGFSEEWKDNETLAAMARRSLGSGAYEAALSNGQTALLKVWKADGIVALTQRTLIERAAALAAQAAELLGRFDENQDYEITYELDDETVTEACDLDQWTMGAYGRMESAIRSLSEKLSKERMTAKELDEAEKKLLAAQEDLPLLEQKARALLIRSRVTEDVANRIHYVLTEMGHWTCHTGDHADGNETAPVEMRYVDDDGNELEFVVSGGQDNEKVKLFLRTQAADGSESHGLSLRQSASDLLEQQGVRMEDVTQSAGCSDDQRDLTQTEIIKNHAETSRWMKEGLRGV